MHREGHETHRVVCNNDRRDGLCLLSRLQYHQIKWRCTAPHLRQYNVGHHITHNTRQSVKPNLYHGYIGGVGSCRNRRCRTCCRKYSSYYIYRASRRLIGDWDNNKGRRCCSSVVCHFWVSTSSESCIEGDRNTLSAESKKGRSERCCITILGCHSITHGIDIKRLTATSERVDDKDIRGERQRDHLSVGERLIENRTEGRFETRCVVYAGIQTLEILCMTEIRKKC